MESVSSGELSVVVPVYEEGAAIVPVLEGIFASVPADSRVFAVFDASSDSTVPYLEEYARRESRLKPVLNTYGRGAAFAVRSGLDRADTDVVVVTMGDGSDDPDQIVEMADMVRAGAAVAAASRYVAGGGLVGGPLAKRTLSRLAGLTLHRFAGLPIHDATSAYKAYSVEFIRSISIQSTGGFEITLELVAKAHRLRLPMVEIPTVWRDRTEGVSHFRLLQWLPQYLRWYWFTFGRPLTPAQLEAKTTKRSRT
jgi:dolichol-phosphate mannosyltransferase